MKDSTAKQLTRAARVARGIDPVIIIVSGGSLGRTFKITEPEYLIGRTLDAEIRLNEDAVSRRHAKLICERKSHVRVVDLDSTNGIFVNGSRVQDQVLDDGDYVQVGPVALLKFAYRDQTEEQVHRMLYESATRDGLTGAYNRRFFTEQLEKDFSHAARHQQPLSLLLLDLDELKRINDDFGHPAGDAALEQLGRSFQQTVRKEDVVCRIGGDEFSVIMRDSSEAAACVLARRLQALAETRRITHRGQLLPSTVSVGVATLDVDRHASATALVEDADRLLYRAKRGGRNRVCSPTLLS